MMANQLLHTKGQIMVAGSFTTALVLATVLSPLSVHNGGKSGPTFKSVGKITGTGVGSNLSDDGRAITYLFDSAIVDSEKTGAGSKVVTVRTPLNPHDNSVVISQDFRGYVSKDEGTEASLVVVVAGQTHTLPLPCGKSNDDQEFDVRVNTVIQPGAHYVATISLVTHRLSDDKNAVAKLDLDSLNLSIRGVACRPRPCCCR